MYDESLSFLRFKNHLPVSIHGTFLSVIFIEMRQKLKKYEMSNLHFFADLRR